MEVGATVMVDAATYYMYREPPWVRSWRYSALVSALPAPAVAKVKTDATYKFATAEEIVKTTVSGRGRHHGKCGICGGIRARRCTVSASRC